MHVHNVLKRREALRIDWLRLPICNLFFSFPFLRSVSFFLLHPEPEETARLQFPTAVL